MTACGIGVYYLFFFYIILLFLSWSWIPNALFRQYETPIMRNGVGHRAHQPARRRRGRLAAFAYDSMNVNIIFCCPPDMGDLHTNFSMLSTFAITFVSVSVSV